MKESIRKKNQNKPKNNEGVPPGAKSTEDLVRLGMMARNTFHYVVLLQQVYRVRDPGTDVPEERLDMYRNDAAEFLRVTQAMADCTGTQEDRVWLARRNRTVLQMTPEIGRSCSVLKVIHYLWMGERHGLLMRPGLTI